MSKATTAIVSLLFVACVAAFSHWISAQLAASGIVSAVFLAVILALSIAGAGWRRSLRLDPRGNAQGRQGSSRRHGRPRHGLLGHGLAAACLLLLPVPLLAGPAQTAAHFAGWQTTVGTGLSSPQGVAVDASGNVYIADTGNNRVLIETLAAGTYTQTTVGTGLSSPQGVAVDASGNVYIADAGNNRVLIETLSEGTYTQTTVGSGLSGPQGVAVDASGSVYIADTGNSRVLIETLSEGTYTQSVVDSELSVPGGVAVDSSGNVYVGDTGDNQVLIETLSGETYTPSAVASGLANPQGVAVDANGNVSIANCCSNQVLIETLSGDIYTPRTVGVGLNEPFGVAVGANGNVYIADTSNNRVLKVQTAANFGSLALATTSPVISMAFSFDSAGTIGAAAVLTQGAAGLDFADAGTGTCTTNGTSHFYASGDSCTIDVTFTPQFPGTRFGAAVLQSNAGNTIASGRAYGMGLGSQVNFVPGTQFPITSGLSFPYALAVDAQGNVFISEEETGIVYKETPSGGAYTATQIATGLNSPGGVAVDGAGNVFVADISGGEIHKETLSNATYSDSTVVTGLGNLDGLAEDAMGNLYVTSYSGQLVYKETLQSNGTYIQTEMGSGFSGPTGVAVDAAGNVYISNDNSGDIFKETLQANGTYVQTTLLSDLNQPESVLVDNNGNLYIATTGTGTLLKETLQTDSTYIQSTILSGVTSIWWIAADQMGNIFINQSSGTESKLVLGVPPVLTFLPTSVGATSADSPQIVTVSNIGTAALSFPVPASGSNPSISLNFTLNSTGDTACPAVAAGAESPGSLAAGASCLLPISFSPTGTGSPLGSLVLTDSSLDATGPAYAAQTIILSGTVAPSATTTTLTASPNPLGDGQLLTLTATVAPAPSGTPDGTVSFYSGTALLGTATLSTSGVAIFTLSSLVVGTDSLTAAYSGNEGFFPSTSAAVSLKVTTSYTISAPATPFDVAEGGSVTINITVPPLGGAFNSPVTLAASGLPVGATATFNPPTVTPGATGGQTVMTIQLASLSAGMPARQAPVNRGGFPTASLSLAFLLFGAVLTRKRIPRGLVLVLALAGVAATTSLLSSCNGGFQNVPQTAAGTYVVTVTGTSGTIQSSAAVTLVVE